MDIKRDKIDTFCVCKECEEKDPILMMRIADISYEKFMRDARKYRDWCILPHCDICNDVYPHFYVTDEVWKESGLDGWTCPSCLERALKREITPNDMLSKSTPFWENLFEVHMDMDDLDKIIYDMWTKTKYISFQKVLKGVYGIDIKSKNRSQYLKFEDNNHGIIQCE